MSAIQIYINFGDSIYIKVEPLKVTITEHLFGLLSDSLPERFGQYWLLHMDTSGVSKFFRVGGCTRNIRRRHLSAMGTGVAIDIRQLFFLDMGMSMTFILI